MLLCLALWLPIIIFLSGDADVDSKLVPLKVPKSMALLNILNMVKKPNMLALLMLPDVVAGSLLQVVIGGLHNEDGSAGKESSFVELIALKSGV